MTSAHTYSRQILFLFMWLLVTFTAAAIGSVASIQAAEFYQQLERPPWAPPASVFGPVWTLLYLFIAISAWLIWRENSPVAAKRRAYIFFFIQLILNALWSWLFFGWKTGEAALFEMVLLWLFILLTTIQFWKIKPAAGILMLPYLGWVSFAFALCYQVWRYNPYSL